MKRSFRHLIFLTLVLAFSTKGIAQTPSDAIMMSDGQICLFAIYTNESFDEYWEGTLLRTNGNFGTLTRHTIIPGFALGLGKHFNVLAQMPWVKTEASAGYVKGASGLQDWGLFLKGKALDAAAGPGDVTFLASAGLTGPVSNYQSDYAPFTLGMGCLDLSLRGILQYKLDAGPYLRGNVGYHLRGNSKLERDYYYTNTGIYSDVVDMPNAVSYGINLGTWLLNDHLKIDLAYEGMNTIGGFDIRRQDSGFPSNNMDVTRVGGNIQVYPGSSGFGFLAGASQVLTGRNAGKSTILMGGITYQFGLWNTAEPEVINN